MHRIPPRLWPRPHTRFRQLALATLTAAAAIASPGTVQAVPSSSSLPGTRELYRTSFEEGEPIPPLSEHELDDKRRRTGKRSITGEIKGRTSGCFLRVPFVSSPDKRLNISCWVFGKQGMAVTLFARAGRNSKTRVRLGSKFSLNTLGWQQIRASYRTSDGPSSGVIEIVAPSGWSGTPGRIWIDDLTITESVDLVNWQDFVEDFPVLTCDGTGALWMALLDRPIPRKRVSIYRFVKGERQLASSFEPDGLTGIAPPAIAPLADGCAVAIPFEKDDDWKIGVVFVPGGTGKAAPAPPVIIDGKGTTDLQPAIATVGDRVCLLWQSNAGESRGIHACWIDKTGAGEPQRLSADGPHANSYNPALVALPDGSLFGAWDSFRDQGANIHGARYRDGQWQPEQKITSGARMERHPSLAVNGNEIWMAWQSVSFLDMKLNNSTEQRIAVARIGADGSLSSPPGFFDQVSTAPAKLMRPQIGFDDDGRLWLTARQSAGKNAGWLPVAWSYSGSQWSGPHDLVSQQGRWRPVSLAWTPQGGVAAAQYDDIDGTQGIRDDWQSGIALVGLPAESLPEAAPLEVEPLRMPDTEFSLPQKMEQVSASFPRQTWEHAGDALKLYWGDFHDHTDLSICGRAVNPPGVDLFANVRDLERLDFAALTDHGYNLDRPQWAYNGEQTRANHDPGRFLAFLGQEWTSKKNPPEGGVVTRSTPMRHGHRNLVFLDPYYDRFYDAMDGFITPRDLWNEIGDEEYIAIPHQIADWKGEGRGNPPTDWSYTDEHLQPVAEIFQTRQSYEYLGCPRQAPDGTPFKGSFLQDAWARGIVIGVIASPDHGGGNGKVAVWAKDLTRKAILDAVRARHCYGTSGAKMGLWFSAGDVRMGDKVERPDGEAITFQVKALAERDIKELVIFRNNEIVHRIEPNQKQTSFDWTDPDPPSGETLWYYARIQAVDEELAWTSPIWFTP